MKHGHALPGWATYLVNARSPGETLGLTNIRPHFFSDSNTHIALYFSVVYYYFTVTSTEHTHTHIHMPTLVHFLIRFYTLHPEPFSSHPPSLQPTHLVMHGMLSNQ